MASLNACPTQRAFGTRQPRRCSVAVRAASSISEREKPAWTGDSALSQFVNWAISVKPLYGAMKVLAKKALKSSAEDRGVRWDAHVREMQQVKELSALKARFEAESPAAYPPYYLQPFHAYDDGNLDWLAAFEVMPATYATGIRTFKEHPEWSAEKCFTELRGRASGALTSYMSQHGVAPPAAIADMGCSTGLSTAWLAAAFPGAQQVTGLDLSPHFLAVAEYDMRRGAAAAAAGVAGKPAAPIRFVRGLAEASPFADGSLDLVAFNFVIHECPQAAIRSFIAEAHRVLRRGGVLNFVDNNPKSATIQNLPPAIFTLMKSTEPWSDEYYAYDVEAAMRAAGFREVVTVESDHRHRCVMGIKQ